MKLRIVINLIMISLVVQAGGKSSRMGQDKGLVPLNGKPLIEHVISRLDGLVNEILITTNHPADYKYLKIPLARDSDPGAGALSGLQTALKAANGERILVIACDMPFVNRGLVKYMLSISERADVVIPEFEKRLQPLHALYHRSRCLAAVEVVLREGKKRMISFHHLVSVSKISSDKVKAIDPTGQSFLNINTQEDLSASEQLLTNGRNRA